MIGWLLKSIGVSQDISTRLDQAQLMWARPWLLWTGLVLLVPVAIFIVWRHRKNLPHVPPGLRFLLSTCRVLVLLVMILVLGGPYLRIEDRITQKAMLPVIIDESASMTLPAGPFEEAEAQRLANVAGLLGSPKKDATAPDAKPGEKPADKPATPAASATPAVNAPLTPEARKKLNALSRVELTDATLAHLKNTTLKELSERFDVRAYRIARQVRTGVLGETPKDALTTGEADETDLGRAIELALDDTAGRSIAGIVIFSDGRWTTGPDPIAVMQRVTGQISAARESAAAAALATGGKDKSPGSTPTSQPADAGVPVWTVPVGTSKPFADVAVADILAPVHVAKGDNITVMATIDSTGLDNRAVQVKLNGPDGKTLDTKPLTLSSVEKQHIQLSFKAETPGGTALTVLVDPQPEEQVKQNNSQTTMVEVDTDRMKILWIEGYPRWDFRFLDHSLRTDNGLDVTLVMEAQLIGKGVKEEELAKAAKLPEDAAGFAEYGLVMLGDISPAMLPPRFQEQLAKAVEEEGLGLLVQGGSMSMPRKFAHGPLARLLPVKIDTTMAPNESAASGGAMPILSGIQTGLEAPPFAPFHMKVTALGAIHPAFRLFDNATQSRNVWSRMPEFYWTAGVKEAGEGASVLAKIDTPGPAENYPIMAERYAGRGRVMFIGIDGTYRWRKNIGSHLFYRFWGQAIRHVARDKNRGKDKSWIEVNPSRLEPGEPASIELFAVDSSGQPLSSGEITVQVAGTEFADRVVLPKTGQPGIYRGQWTPKSLGQFKLTYSDAKERVVAATVQVSGSGRELRKPVVDREMLATLADATKGRMLELDELPQLTTLVKGEALKITQSHESEIWDNWLTLVLLVVLYSIDVGVRRLLGLT